MDITRSRERLNSLLSYILGRNPAEFGLVVDDDGYIKIKELLRVMSEEEGWKHVREGGIQELVIAMPEPAIEISGELIRAVKRENLEKPVYRNIVPKILFIGIRKNAHYHVSENGIKPYDNKPYVILSSDRDMAERIAKRKDPAPVILTVNTRDAENSGVLFLHAGESLFLANEIPVKCFYGPPLTNPEKDKEGFSKKKNPVRKTPPEPGSFIPHFSDPAKDRKQKIGKEDRVSWKHNKKKLRKQKEQYWGDY